MTWILHEGPSTGYNQSVYTGPPAGFDPATAGGRVPSRWTWPFYGYTQPILEMPQNKIARISAALDAWLGEPILNTSSKLTVGLTFENMNLTVRHSMWTETPPWIPERERGYWEAEYGENFREMASAYVEKQCWKLVKKLSIMRFIADVGMDMVLSGDGYVNIASNCTPAEESPIYLASDAEELAAAVNNLRDQRIQSGRSPEYKILALQGLNPSACWLYPDFTGRIVDAKVIHTMGEGNYSIDLNNLLHFKADGFNWTVYGVSSYIAALQWVNIKFKLMEAMYLNASRYVTPREWMTVRGPKSAEGAELPPTEQQMDWVQYILQYYASGQPFAMPSGWDWNMMGAEGKVLKIEGLLEVCNDAIRTAAQISPTFASGSAKVPAFATTKLQVGMMDKSRNKLKGICSEALEGGVFNRFVTMNGWFDVDGEPLSPSVQFFTRPIQGDDTTEKRIATLGPMGYLSPQTAWEMVGLDGTQEYQRILEARKGLIRTGNVTSPTMSPENDPQRFIDPEVVPLAQAMKARGHKFVMGATDKMLARCYTNWGTQSELDKAVKTVQKYVTQAQYLVHAQNNGISMDEQEEVMRENNGKGSTLTKFGSITREVRASDTDND